MENTQIQSKQMQNKLKLEACLENVDNAIILIEVNDKQTESDLTSLLHKRWNIEMVCFQQIKDDFISLLYSMSESESLRKVCFYAFDPQPDTYDIVKSLNISREILSKVGILIFLMPSILVRQIEYEETNLHDYILLKLDYTVKCKLPFEPIFSIQYASRYEKEERQNLKYHASKISVSTDERMKSYFFYLQKLQYKSISRQEYEDKLCTFLQETEAYIQKQNWKNESDKNTALLDVWYRTAQTLAAQSFLRQAFDLFVKMKVLLEKYNRIDIYYLHALEGLAFCFYHLQQYDDAKKALLIMISVLENNEVENEAWKYRIYNDYAACFYKAGDVIKARDIWIMCGNGLAALNIANAARNYRNKYNLMLAHIASCDNLYIYYREWAIYQDSLLNTEHFQSIRSSEGQLLTSWIEGMIFGKTEHAVQRAAEVLKVNCSLLHENDYMLALNNYVLSKLYSQKGDEENAQYHIRKCTNILKNCKLTNQYLKDDDLLLNI